MKQLNLTRPLVSMDIETTGTNTKVDRIVEITIIKHFPDGTSMEITHLVDPGIEIPEGASAIHGIRNNDVFGKPYFKNIAQDILVLINDSDICGFNAIRFDIPLLQEEFARCGLEFSLENRYVMDPMVIFHNKEPRDLSAAYRKYCGEELNGSHSSLVDARAAHLILLGQMEYYSDIGDTAEELHNSSHNIDPSWIDEGGRLIRNTDGVTLGFGKYQGRHLNEIAIVDSDYLNWILNKDFSNSVKVVVQEALALSCLEEQDSLGNSLEEVV